MSSAVEPISLLLVDDEADYLHVLKKRLQKRGMAVSLANSGAEAIKTLRTQDFTVAVLDLKMQDMDGIEVLKIFKKMDPELEVIMLTGHGSEQAAREGASMGAFDYLTKPCDLMVLHERILAAAQKARDAAAAGSE